MIVTFVYSRIKSRCSDYIDRKAKLQRFYEKKNLIKTTIISRSINDNIFLFIDNLAKQIQIIRFHKHEKSEFFSRLSFTESSSRLNVCRSLVTVCLIPQGSLVISPQSLARSHKRNYISPSVSVYINEENYIKFPRTRKTNYVIFYQLHEYFTHFIYLH